MTEKQRKNLALLGVIIYILFIAAVAWFIGRPLLRFISEPEKFRLWVEESGWFGRLAFLGMSVLQMLVVLIPGEPLEMGAGYAFGAVEGTLLCLMGSFLGGALVFLFVRRFGIKAVEIFFSREKIDSLRFLQSEKKLKRWVFLYFLIPGTPKALMTYFVPLTRMQLGTFLLLSCTARIPSIITSTFSGDALGTGSYIAAAIILGVTVVVGIGGVYLYRYIHAKKSK